MSDRVEAVLAYLAMDRRARVVAARAQEGRTLATAALWMDPASWDEAWAAGVLRMEPRPHGSQPGDWYVLGSDGKHYAMEAA